MQTRQYLPSALGRSGCLAFLFRVCVCKHGRCDPTNIQANTTRVSYKLLVWQKNLSLAKERGWAIDQTSSGGVDGASSWRPQLMRRRPINLVRPPIRLGNEKCVLTMVTSDRELMVMMPMDTWICTGMPVNEINRENQFGRGAGIPFRRCGESGATNV